MDVLAADGHEDLADGDTRCRALGLAESAAHAGLQPIRAGAREHLVDAQHVERVHLRGSRLPYQGLPKARYKAFHKVVAWKGACSNCKGLKSYANPKPTHNRVNTGSKPPTRRL